VRRRVSSSESYPASRRRGLGIKRGVVEGRGGGGGEGGVRRRVSSSVSYPASRRRGLGTFVHWVVLSSL